MARIFRNSGSNQWFSQISGKKNPHAFKTFCLFVSRFLKTTVKEQNEIVYDFLCTQNTEEGVLKSQKKTNNGMCII